MNSSQLSKMIEKIVEKEIAKRLPALVESVLTERYLKHLVSEQVQNGRPASLKEVMEQEDEDQDRIPRPMNNSDDGIYQSDPLFKNESKKNPAVNEALEKLKKDKGGSFWASFYEDVEPVSHYNAPVSPVVQEQVPERVLNQMIDMNHMRRLAEKTIPKAKQTAQVDPSLILENRRKRLDEMHVGEAPKQLSTMQISRNQLNQVFSHDDDPFEARMRELDREIAGRGR